MTGPMTLESWQMVARLLVQRLGGDVVISHEEIRQLVEAGKDQRAIIVVTNEPEGLQCKLITTEAAMKIIKKAGGSLH